jgi:hypothetical protein
MRILTGDYAGIRHNTMVSLGGAFDDFYAAGLTPVERILLALA